MEIIELPMDDSGGVHAELTKRGITKPEYIDMTARGPAQ
jgi:hypothetical protein